MHFVDFVYILPILCPPPRFIHTMKFNRTSANQNPTMISHEDQRIRAVMLPPEDEGAVFGVDIENGGGQTLHPLSIKL